MIPVRVGMGYDVHRLTEGRKLILGGIEIPFEKGLEGHSDADVLVHAIMDAIIGALGEGDIGHWFPDTDDSYLNISSLVLLKKVVGRMKEENYGIGNIDACLIAQRPKIAPYIPAMKKTLCRTMQIDERALNLKATTEEKLGFTGRGEGMAAQAVCLLVRQEEDCERI